jgi:glycosyltransferase involved in cell wall biosynthesis
MSEPGVVVSVVMPVRNGMPLVTLQLEALARQNYDQRWELIIADNGSTDGTRAEVQRFADQLPLVIVEAPAAIGVAAVRNLGAQHATGRHILFCDADDVADESWVAAMSTGLERYGAVGGVIELEQLNDAGVVSSSGITGDRLDLVGGYLYATMGCSIGVRADAFRTVGGFDLRFKGVAEDTDFCWRIQLAGYEFGFESSAVMHYRLRASLRASLRQSRIYARGAAQLASVYSHEFSGDTAADVVRTVAWLATRSPNLVLGARRRRKYLRALWYLWGQLEGSREFHVKYRTYRPLRRRESGSV